jgi:hypothetical protein
VEKIFGAAGCVDPSGPPAEWDREFVDGLVGLGRARVGQENLPRRPAVPLVVVSEPLPPRFEPQRGFDVGLGHADARLPAREPPGHLLEFGWDDRAAELDLSRSRPLVRAAEPVIVFIPRRVMCKVMSRARMGPFARWVLLCALALGVVAMHHVPDPGPSMTMDHSVVMPTGVTADQQQAPSDMGDMLHVCLAVLGGLLALALTLFLLTSMPEVSTARFRAAPAGIPARAPPWRRGRDILESACVLRV